MSESKQSTRIQNLILGIISNETTEEDKWISLNQVKKSLIMKYGLTQNQIEKYVKPQLKLLEKNSILIRKHTSYALTCLSTYLEYQKMMEKTSKNGDSSEPATESKEGKQKKTKPEKDLGPDVVITSTGRVSVKKSYVF